MMPWKKGQSGNPAGKAKGTRNRATLLALAAMESELEAIVRRIIDAAKDGDMAAARLIVDKLIPVSRETPIQMALTPITNIASCRIAQAEVIAAVSSGELFPSQAEAVSTLIEHQRRGLESEALEERLKAIEEKLGIQQGGG